MSKYVRGNKIINATEKAYNTLYKTQGYMPYVEKTKTKKKEEANK